MYLLRYAIICALLFSISNAQSCQSVFEKYTVDKSYWYGFSIQDISRKTKINKISNEVLSTAISKLTSSIYSDVNSNLSLKVNEEMNDSYSSYSESIEFDVDISSKIYGLEYEVVSQGRCDSQYYTLVRLNKKAFNIKQRSSLISALNQFESLSSSNFSILYDYLTFLNDLYEKIDNNYFGLIDPSYQKKVSDAKNSLKNEYIKSLSSIKPAYNYTIPYSVYDDRSNFLEISFISNSSKLKIVSGKVDVVYFQNKNISSFDSSGNIVVPISDKIRNSSFVSLELSLNFNELLSSHEIFNNTNLKNLQFSYTIKPQPLILNFENNFSEEEVSKRVAKTLNSVFTNSISVKLEIDDTAIYTLKVDALEYEKKYNKSIGVYLHHLDEVSISLIDNLNGYVIFSLPVESLKGLSYLGYDEALDNLMKKVRKEGSVIAKEIEKNIL